MISTAFYVFENSAGAGIGGKFYAASVAKKMNFRYVEVTQPPNVLNDLMLSCCGSGASGRTLHF